MRVPDKKTVMCGFLIRPFYFAGRERNGLINRENPTNLLQVSVRRLWQRHDHIGLLYRGTWHGGANSQGPDGTAALAVVAPIWNIIYSLGLLMGIGGSVIFSTLRGQTERKGKVENEYFTTAVIGAAVLSVIAWLAILFFEKPILLFFGADINLLSLAQTIWNRLKSLCRFSCSTRCWLHF